MPSFSRFYLNDDYIKTDIDDCAVNPCLNGGACTDGVNSFTCACAAGYTDNTCSTGNFYHFYNPPFN